MPKARTDRGSTERKELRVRVAEVTAEDGQTKCPLCDFKTEIQFGLTTHCRSVHKRKLVLLDEYGVVVPAKNRGQRKKGIRPGQPTSVVTDLPDPKRALVCMETYERTLRHFMDEAPEISDQPGFLNGLRLAYNLFQTHVREGVKDCPFGIGEENSSGTS